VESQTTLNRQWYPVLELTVEMMGEESRLTPAFPVNADDYQLYGLTSQFVESHRKATREMLDDLSLTRPPTEREIRREAESYESELSVPEGPGTATPTGPGGAAGETDAARAIRSATNDLVYKQAKLGWMYLSDDVMEHLSLPPDADPNYATMWRQQYKLWIGTDIARAIKATNEEVLQQLPEDGRNVLNAAVKHWLDVQVDDEYFCKAGTSYDGAKSGPPAGGPPGPGHGPGPMGPTGHLSGAAPVGTTEGSITGRYTNKEREVIHYSFTVVMPTRHLMLLERKLTNTMGRFHMVRQWQAERLPFNTGLYYYGNEPVMRITLECEFQMLTSWERDLIPVEFLRSLPKNVLRSEDEKRIRDFED
jgi:hypothetical protein